MKVPNHQESQIHQLYGFTVWEIGTAIILGLILFSILNGVTHLVILCFITVYTVLVGICCLWGRHLSTVLHFLVSLIFLFILCLVCGASVFNGYSGNLSRGLPCNTPAVVSLNRRLQEHVELSYEAVNPVSEPSITPSSLEILYIGTKCETDRLGALILGQGIFTSIGVVVLGFLLFHGWKGTQVPFLYHRKLRSHWKKLEFEGRFRFSFWQIFVGVLGGLTVLTIVHLALLDFLIGIPLLLLFIIGNCCWIVLKRGSIIHHSQRHTHKSNVELLPSSSSFNHNQRCILSSSLLIISIASVIFTLIRVTGLQDGKYVQYPTGLGLESPVVGAIEGRQERKEASELLLGTEVPVIANPRDIQLFTSTESTNNGSASHDSLDIQRQLTSFPNGRRLEPIEYHTKQPSQISNEINSDDASIAAGLMSIISAILSIVMLTLALMIVGVENLRIPFLQRILVDRVIFTRRKFDRGGSGREYKKTTPSPPKKTTTDDDYRRFHTVKQQRPLTIEDVKRKELIDEDERIQPIVDDVQPDMNENLSEISVVSSIEEGTSVIPSSRRASDRSQSCSERSTITEWCKFRYMIIR